MDFKTIDFSVQDQVARLWLNRPEKRNAMNVDMLQELRSLFESLSQQGEVGALVIRGHGKVFCAGADLVFMSDVTKKSDDELKSEGALFYDCFESLYMLSIPVICYAHGAVHGGGNGLLAVSDFVFSTENTRFSFSEVGLGLVPATVAPFVLRRMGTLKARQCMISGKVMDGREAYSAGLVDHLVSHDKAEMEIEKLTALLKQNAPGAVKKTKKLFVDLENRLISEDLKDLTTDIIAHARRGEEAREGLDAFFSKRMPNWVIKK
jgi:methylglutaconyl-CoA hydratase